PLLCHHPATPATPTLSLHDALPISLMCSRPSTPSAICRKAPYFLVLVTRPGTALPGGKRCSMVSQGSSDIWRRERLIRDSSASRSEEHTSELQSPCNLVCRLLLEKK